ncbi:MAG: HNH endonuclease [Armatimonadetes bacterium]|nr:HNH endonuclease [Armatimonadota bacterium]
MSDPRITAPVGRSTKEWIGSTPDAKVPAYVRARVFDRAKGICHISGRKIEAGERWDLEHIIALRDGGQHRESNLAPALADKHLLKTAKENSLRAVVKRKRNAHTGALSPSTHPIRTRRTVVEREARFTKPTLPPRSLYQDA